MSQITVKIKNKSIAITPHTQMIARILKILVSLIAFMITSIDDIIKKNK